MTTISLICPKGRAELINSSKSQTWLAAGTDQLTEVIRLQKENERLREAVSELTLDKLILSDVAKGNF